MKPVKIIMMKAVLPYPYLIEVVKENVGFELFDRVWRITFSLTARIVPNKVCDAMERRDKW